MNTKEKFTGLPDAYRNQTKMSIIFLLAENEKMTVTQMSKHISVSRANLYHFVSQMVEEKILNEPEIRPKKNYVEKYYSLNSELFGAIQWGKLEEVFGKMSVDEVRELLKSFLIGQAFNLSILAEKVQRASDDQIEKLKNALLVQEAFIVYSISSLGAHPDINNHLREIMGEFEKESPKETPPDVPLVRTLFLVLPYL